MMPQGPLGLVCTTNPVYPLDMPICPMLVSGWTGWVDGATLNSKTTALKASNIRSGGVVCQLPPTPPNRLQDQQRGLR